MASADRCVCCGEYVPEGRQVCWSCEDRYADRTRLYDEICRTLTDFEQKETTESKKASRAEWNNVFYRLLCKVQIECNQTTIKRRGDLQ